MRGVGIVLLLCSLGLAGCGNRNPPVIAVTNTKQAVIGITALEGRPKRLNFAAELNPDCTSRGLPVVQIIEAPANGATTASKASDYTSFVPANQRSACNKGKSTGTLLTYRANPGYTGMDSLIADTIFSDGAVTRVRYVITVR